MSHVDTGFAIKDLEALRQAVQEHCPQLEMVQQNRYRTWLQDHGSLAEDTALPGTYQLQLLLRVLDQNPGMDVHAEARKAKVELPEDLRDLETKPWSHGQQVALLRTKTFRDAYEYLEKSVIGQDAEYVIRYKDEQNRKTSYEIGIVPNPLRPDEYSLVTDYYAQGRGLLHAEGVGKADSQGVWGALLKHNYAVAATERHAEQGIAAGLYRSYTRQTTSEGVVSFEIEPN